MKMTCGAREHDLVRKRTRPGTQVKMTYRESNLTFRARIQASAANIKDLPRREFSVCRKN